VSTGMIVTRRVAPLLSWLIAALLATGCGDAESPAGPKHPQVAEVVVMGPGANLRLDDTVRLRAEARDGAGSRVGSVQLIWESGDTSVARVDSTGLVTALGQGRVTIRAKAGAASGGIDLTVLPDYTEVATGFMHSCALTPDGAAYCWGKNYNGVLGAGVRRVGFDNTPCFEMPECSAVPVAVVGEHHFVELASRNGAVCGRTAADEVFCWGNSENGEAGSIERNGVPTPRRVDVSRARSLVAGNTHVCALDDAGASWCWGSNGWGELGDGRTGPLECRLGPCNPVPVRAAPGLTFRAIDAGSGSTCGITHEDAVYCWGRSDGTTLPVEPCGTSVCWLTPRRVSGDTRFRSVSTGNGFACGIEVTQRIYCWGSGFSHELGANVPFSDRPVPVLSNDRFTDVDSGDAHSCAISTTGAAYCWGFGGEWLAIETPSFSGIPQPVVGGLTFRSIRVGWRHSCGLSRQGALYCWGTNFSGYLGIGSFTPVAVPTRVRRP
jgi:alpha-tubulin suppressor-like RCC1 family protein